MRDILTELSRGGLKGELEMDAYNVAILKAVSALADAVAGKGGGCCPAVMEAVRIHGGVAVIDGIEYVRAGICREVVDEVTDRYAATLARMMDNLNLPAEEAERLDHEIADIAAEVRAIWPFGGDGTPE